MDADHQIKDHRDLIAWQKVMNLVTSIYKASKNFPKEELYGLTSQLRRAAVSIPANIAEGQGRRSKPEFRQFLGHARGSLLEVDTHLEIALRLEYLSLKEHSQLHEQLKEIGRIINGLLRSLTSDL
jgi:four helix bundle protein